MSPKVWLITGASTGFGRELTKVVLDHNDIAVATARRPEALSDLASSYPASKLLVLQLDVTKPSDITRVFAAVKDKFGRVDVVVNNAAAIDVGEVEAVREADARGLFDVNFWGTANVSREAVRFMREDNPAGAGGRILQITSNAGIQGFPAMAYYGASKAAVEGFTESLAAEIDPEWNIKLTCIAPGPFNTGDVTKTPWPPAHPAYAKPTLPATAWRAGMSQFVRPNDPRKGMEVVYKLAQLQDPPMHFPLAQEAVGSFKAKAAALAADSDRFPEWNEGLVKSA